MKLLTPWGEKLDPKNVLKEYPRPQMMRNSYINLNGLWDYKLTPIVNKDSLFSSDNTGTLPFNDPDGKILVPFSPESELSGVNHRLSDDELIIYQYCYYPTKSFNIGKVLLHLDAVDSTCAIFINGKRIAEHIGGYWGIEVDITSYITPETIINVAVFDAQDNDYLARGKQRINNKNIWYTAQSGIWQSVWLESVPKDYIESLKITPDLDNSTVKITVNSAQSLPCAIDFDGNTYKGNTNDEIIIPVKSPIEWSPENPHLYYFKAVLHDDIVSSYFAMRKFSVGEDENGFKRLMLNNKPYFHNGLLDQGYWSDGLMTPPDDEAMIYDIQTMKDMGFNMLRKHIKIEPLRWYYHCDRLGMLVWQDMVCGGDNFKVPGFMGRHVKDNKYKSFGRESEENRNRYYIELTDTINMLYNCPCIAMWVPFNEGWGQFDALVAVDKIRELDSTRTIDHASGWHDQHGGDVKSKHVYFIPYKHKNDRYNRPTVLSEFGGYSLRVKGHMYTDEREFGYMKIKTPEDLTAALRKLYETEIIPAKAKGLSAAVYTQVSDIEEEINGLLTYDRKVVKVPIGDIAVWNAELSDD